ncbi:protein kinase A regulatory subunit [Dictyostelium discoideum AX4]|uniref:cAMP-dependent protein kinase regulatory subunit n=1 Tax=Dictyostelium discoideum TaxID=44689 RepID=KAPR_DICDI|nr:protein kinase A regulatory subunit [Dictyostelium discoideum AX4]P05987.1 RecName: Full=cAMP-dependent protein kinase regulatory subunit; AltName: Full=Protein kinase A, regulatory subunit; AltName: Full=Rapid development protein C [Dictyostelium discoideum]AAA33236.1 protein kinase regulatory subunit (E.C 2.7.1.37) [Dictyostelium discoideum]EAL67645.1 protein kinase A regulatory subunit [Dictyostelium discoideum AX4]|eukprot:XP_641686.1 protein kinase A regulatory subunit [Dictyostelium discoideum AX4]
MTNNISHNQKATEKVEAQNNNNITRKRRGAISSEPLGDKPATPLPNIPKTVETQQRLEQALSNNIMFSHLEEEERNVVFLAMVEVLYKAGDIIIKQGDEGDLFYVIDSGICDIYVCQNGGSPTLVMEVFEGGSFGELALIYGSPRAATVIARTDVRLWALNGATYRRILMDQTIKKRKLYEEFLEKVSILRHIDKYERVSLADALEPVNFQDGEVIVRQGDPGDRFYIIVEGKVVVTQETVPGDHSTSHVVSELHPSDYFGEIALLTDRPRAATVTSIGYTKCVELDRQRFNRLCGPIDQMLRRNMETYNQFLNRPPSSPNLTSQKS